MGVRLNAVMSVLGDKRANPWTVVAIEHGLFGTAHDQTVKLYKLFSADVPAVAAKIRERKIRSAPVKRGVGHDPKCEIVCQRNDPVQDAGVVSLLDGGREVAREERAIVKVVVQNLPFEIPEDACVLQDRIDADRLRVLGINFNLASSVAQKLGEACTAYLDRRRRQQPLSLNHGSFGFYDGLEWSRMNAHARWRAGNDIGDKAGNRVDALVVDLSDE